MQIGGLFKIESLKKGGGGLRRTSKEDGCSRKVGGREKTKTGEETERCSPDDVAVWAFADPS